MNQTGRTDETKQLTYTAFWEIFSQGKPPSVDLINDWLLVKGHGKRNRNTISERLKECWAQAGSKINQDRSIPGLPEDTIDLVVTLRDNLLGVARKEFEVSLQDAQQQAEQLVTEAQGRVTELDQSLQRARDDLATLETQRDRLTSELSTSNDRLLAIQADLARSQATCDAQRQRIADLEAEKKSLEHQMSAMEDTHRISMENEAQRFQVLQKSLMQQVDDERTRGSKLATQLEKLNERMQQQSTEFHNREKELNDIRTSLSAELGQAKGKAEALHVQITALQVSLDNKQRELSSANDLNTSLRTENAELKAKLGTLVGITKDELNSALRDAFIAGGQPPQSGAKASQLMTPEIRARSYAKEAMKAFKG